MKNMIYMMRKHQSIDVTAPLARSRTISADGLTYTIVFNESMQNASGDPEDGFTITHNGASATISSAAISSTSIAFTMSSAIGKAATVTDAYDSASGAIQDLAGNALATYTASSTNQTNNSTVFDPFDYGTVRHLFDLRSGRSKVWEDAGKTDECEDGDGAYHLENIGEDADDASQAASGARPFYRADANSSGYPGIEFDGSSDFMTIGSITYLQTRGTIFYVRIAVDQQSYIFCYDNGGNTGYIGDYQRPVSSGGHISMEIGDHPSYAVYNSSADIVDGNPHVISKAIDSSMDLARARVDDETGSSSEDVSPQGMTNFRLGRNWSGNYTKGFLLYLLMYEEEIGADDFTEIHESIETLYGI